MEENKQLICEKMLELCKVINFYQNVKSLTYIYNHDDDSGELVNKRLPKEYVNATFTNGRHIYIDVSGDSGFKMIMNVFRCL